MLNGDPPLNNLSTEMIQKYLEENKELILAALECQNLGKFAEAAQYQARLQKNLNYLARLADAAATQPKIQSQGQGVQHPQVAMSEQQPDHSSSNLPFDMNDQQQHHVAMSQQQPDRSTLNLPFDMNDEQQQQQQPHVAMSQQQADRSTLNLPFDMNDQQQQQQQQQHVAISLQQPHVAMPQQQLDHSTLNLHFDMNGQQQRQQHHAAMSLRQPHAAMSQQQQSHVAISQQQPDLSTLNLPFDLNEQQQQQQQQQQQHLAMSLQQHDLSTSKMPFQMNEQQHMLPAFFQQQQQFIQGPMGGFPGSSSGMHQTFPTRLGNQSDTPESNQIGSDASSVWSLGVSPSGPYQ